MSTRDAPARSEYWTELLSIAEHLAKHPEVSAFAERLADHIRRGYPVEAALLSRVLTYRDVKPTIVVEELHPPASTISHETQAARDAHEMRLLELLASRVHLRDVDPHYAADQDAKLIRLLAGEREVKGA